MALNAVMLSADGKPVPLPREKVFQSVPKVTINLSPTQPGAPTTSASSATDKGKAPATGSPTLGSVYVTNQRIVFVASNALALPTPSSNPAASQPSLDDIRTLTVPLTHHQDGRFVQPWFSANAHECNFVPVRGGGLDQLLPRGTTTFALKISFNEGGGFEFHEAVEEVKRRLHDAEGRARAGAEAESLPVYSPPAPESAAVFDEPGPSPPPGLPSTPGRQAPVRRGTMPSDDDLAAAEVARQAEAEESDRLAERHGQQPDASSGLARSESELLVERGAPPAYNF